MTSPSLPYFPTGLLREATMLWEIQGAAVSGGQTASGAMPMTRLDGGGIWKCTLGQVGLWSPEKRLAWAALQAICDCGAQPIVVEKSIAEAPWPIVSGSEVRTFPEVPHDDGTFFDDGTGYESGLIEINADGAALLRATAMNVTLIAGQALRGGEHFSIDHADLRHRLYKIRSAVDGGGGSWAITFRPPLRADIDDGTPLDFDHPRCVMRLAKPDSMDATFEPPFNSNPDVSFIEAFPPFPT